MQGLKQELRMRQEQTLQPQQILRSELLQLQILDLQMRVQAELVENPLLEEIPEEDAAESESDEFNADSADSTDAGEETSEAPDVDTPAQTEEARTVDWDDILNDTEHWEFRAHNRVSSEDNTEIPQPDLPTLTDHLHEQLHMDNLTPLEVRVGVEIIGNINRDGRLDREVDFSLIAATCGATVADVERIHARVMGYDPVGIGARDLRECLAVQLKEREPAAPIALRLIEEFWEDFFNKRYELLAEKLGLSLDEIKAAFEVVTHLNPKPGEGSFTEKQNYIIPDLIVIKIGDEFEVYLNDGEIPNFRINSAYREMYLGRKDSEKQVREFLSRKLESARWFINAIHQRRTTMLRTMRAIVDRQRDFFEYGHSQLKPMILQDIADDISVHPSTVSRAKNGKYVQTDWGVYELKYFFTDSMTNDDGEEISNRVIKERLRDIIEGEDKRHPLSDQDLTDKLNLEGFNIKRRTVAKYREQLRIPIKRMRREI